MAHMPSAAPRRWRFLFVVAVLLGVLTTSIPVVNWLQRPHGSTYTGYSYESVGDIFVYLNLIEQAKNGQLLFSDFFTSEAHAGILFNPLYLILGWTARTAHLSPLVVWHLFRILFLVAFVLLLYRVLGWLTADEAERRVTLIAVLSTGALMTLNHEASTFLSLLYSPMATLTLLLSLGYFYLFARAAETGMTPGKFLVLAALGILQSTIHPYVVVLWVVVPIVHVFLGALLGERRRWATATLALPPLLIGIFYSLYQYLSVVRSPILRAWAENAMLGAWQPGPLLFFLGMLGLFALVAIIVCRKELFRNPFKRLLLILLFVGLAATQTHAFPYAYRLPILLHLPLAYFAAKGFLWLWKMAHHALPAQAMLLVLLLPMFSDNAVHFLHNLRRDYPANQKLYLSAAAADALRWLRTSTPDNSVILHSPSWDTLLGYQAYRRVYVTAGWQTASVNQKIFTTLRAYEGAYTPEQLATLFRSNRITHIMVSPLERQSGPWKIFPTPSSNISSEYVFGFSPSRYPFLRKVYDKGGFEVYEVSKQETPTTQKE